MRPILAPNAEDAADDRLYARFLAGQRELHRAKEIAGIGHRHRRHAVGKAKLHQLLGLQCPFRKRIGGMDAQMDEIGMRHGICIGQINRNILGRDLAKQAGGSFAERHLGKGQRRWTGLR